MHKTVEKSSKKELNSEEQIKKRINFQTSKRCTYILF